MTIRFLTALLALSLLLCCAGCEVSSCHTSPPQSRQVPTVQGESETWAVYWYLCGSDLESNWGLATADLKEMLTVPLPEHVQVVIQTGGSLAWHSDIDENSLGRYHYNSEGFAWLESLPDVCMGDPNTLSDFLSFCNQNYPADRQVVVLWNHGGGSLLGVIFDERYEFVSLSLLELRRVLDAVPASSGSYEAICLDACLMATVDMAELLRGHARYMIASVEIEPGYGWDYAAFMATLAQGVTEGGQLGIALCDSYYAACVKAREAEFAALSVVDLSRVGPLVAAYRGMGDEVFLSACEQPQSYPAAFGRAARRAQKYGPNSDNEGYVNMVDLGDLVRRAGNKLLPKSRDEVLAALDDCVIYQVAGPLRARASGISCYYNFAASTEESVEGLHAFSSLGTSRAFAWFTAYSLTCSVGAEGEDYAEGLARAEGLRNFSVPQNVFSRENSGLEKGSVTRTNGDICLQLAAEDLSCTMGVSLRLEIEHPRADTRVSLGIFDCETIDWEGGKFSGGKSSWGAIDGVFVHIDPIDSTQDYALFAVPILLNGVKNILYVCFQQGEYRMVGVREVADDGRVDKNLHPLAVGDVVEPLLPVRVGVSADDPAAWQEMAFDRIVIGAHTSFAEQPLGDMPCYFSFVVTDCSGRTCSVYAE